MLAVPVLLVLHQPRAIADAAELRDERPVADDVLGVRPLRLAIFLDARALDGKQRVKAQQLEKERRGVFERVAKRAIVDHFDAHFAEVEQHLPAPADARGRLLRGGRSIVGVAESLLRRLA